MVSCTRPWRCDDDSIPTPATAPPRVMVLSCGTTAGITPCARQALVRTSYGIIPSASTWFSRMERTSLNPRTSRRRRWPAARSRNRLEVSLARATCPEPPLSAFDSESRLAACAASASAMPEAARRRFGRPQQRVAVEEVARHRVAGGVALGEHDLEEVRAPGRRAEHLGAAVQVHAPDAPEALVEALRVEGADLVPVAVEALGPDVQRERVMAPQVLDVEHLEAGLLHLDDHVGEARDPAAGEHVAADEEVGVVAPDVADEVQQADAALLEIAGVGVDQLGELVAPGVLEAADRGHLVEFAPGVAEVAVHLQRIAQAAALDLALGVVGLRAGGVDRGDLDAVALLRVEHEAAEAAADVDHLLARLEQELLRHVVALVALRLLQRARALLPVGAGVEHQRIVEPQLVELGGQGVVEVGVALRLRALGVRMRELVPAVADPGKGRAALVDAAFHAGGQRLGKAALDVDVAVEVRLEQPDVAERGHAPVGARRAEHQRERRCVLARALLAAVRVAHRERNPGALADRAQRIFDPGSHGLEFYRRVEAAARLLLASLKPAKQGNRPWQPRKNARRPPRPPKPGPRNPRPSVPAPGPWCRPRRSAS